MTESYLAMMMDSLDKKIGLLKRIEEENVRQKEALEHAGSVDVDAFDATVDVKATLIDELDQLNEGFDSLFTKVKQELDGNKDKYKPQIASMQEKIRAITELSGSIQAQEARNRALAEKAFAESRKDMVQGKKSARAALDYYRNMARSTFTPPQYLDSKN